MQYTNKMIDRICSLEINETFIDNEQVLSVDEKQTIEHRDDVTRTEIVSMRDYSMYAHRTHSSIHIHCYRLRRRVDRIENSIACAIVKIDRIIDMFESIERETTRCVDQTNKLVAEVCTRCTNVSMFDLQRNANTSSCV